MASTSSSTYAASGFTVIEGGKTTPLRDTRSRDRDLARRIVERDESAMREVYDLFATPLTRFVANWLGDPNDAADIAHEALLEVWKRAERFEGRSSLKAWIYSIARYKAIDRNRRAVRVLYTDEEPQLVDDGADAEAVVSASEDAVAVQAAMQTLSEAHRRVIHLAFFEDMSYKDIAAIEGCPVGTVKTRILHAKRGLAHALARHPRH